MPRVKVAGLTLKWIVQLAIHFADIIVDKLKLTYDNIDAVFLPMLWTNPGEVVELPEDLICQLCAVVV